MRTKIPALVLAFFVLGISGACAGEKIWVGLYLAENTPPTPNATLAPEKLDHRLREIFGFKQYELIQGQEIELSHHWEQWAMPRKDFFIRIEPLPHPPGAPNVVDYEIYKDGFIVAKGNYEPHRDTPLFINGPDFKEGRLIFVLEAR